MNDFLDFFNTMPNWYKLVWLSSILIGCWLVEMAIPLRKFAMSKWQHARTNLSFLGIALVINLLFGVFIISVNQWTTTNNFGLFNHLAIPIWASLLIAIVLLDLTAQYCAHYLLHKVPFLFRFHMVHHSDTAVDATTGTRLHPGDYLFREILSLALIFVLAMPISYYLIYRLATILFTYFNHANIGLSQGLERGLRWLIVTPNLHKTHHHNEVHWTDSNYGNIFSVWDRLFGTLVINDVKDVNYGLDIMDDAHCNDLMYQLRVPGNSNIRSHAEQTKLEQ